MKISPDVPKMEVDSSNQLAWESPFVTSGLLCWGSGIRSNDFFRLAVGDSCLTREECPCYMEGGSVLRPGDLLRDDCVTM